MTDTTPVPASWLIARDDGDVMERGFSSFHKAIGRLRQMYDEGEYVVLPEAVAPPVPGSRSDFPAGNEVEAVYERAIFAGLPIEWALTIADINKPCSNPRCSLRYAHSMPCLTEKGLTVVR